MIKSIRLAVFICLVVMAIPQMASTQSTVKPVNVAGTWDVTIIETSRAASAGTPGTPTNEQWVLEQNGDKVTGKTRNASREVPLEGTVEGLDGDVLRVQVNGDSQFLVHATVVGDSMSGTIRSYKDRKERLWSAKRAKKSQ